MKLTFSAIGFVLALGMSSQLTAQPSDQERARAIVEHQHREQMERQRIYAICQEEVRRAFGPTAHTDAVIRAETEKAMLLCTTGLQLEHLERRLQPVPSR